MIVLDNIIFNLQRTGGISVVWGELLRRIEADSDIDARYMECANAESNLVRGSFGLQALRILPIKSSLLTLRRLLNPRLRRIRQPFVFHSSYYRTCSNPRALNVTTVHDFTVETTPPSLRGRVHSWQKARAIRRSDCVICVSENTRADLLRFLPDVDPGRVHVVYNGVSPDYRPIPREGLALPFGGDYFLFVGSRAVYKNFSKLLEAFGPMGRNLVIVGAPLTRAEKDALNRTFGPERYRFVGNVDNRRLNELYNGARALLYPSEYEGFGIPTIETQRAGCPVIALRKSSLPEVVGDSPLLIDELTAANLQRCIDILDDPAERRAIVQLGLENSQRFSWESTYQNLKQLYQQLLASAR